MKKLRKLLSLVISTALLITTIPINSFSANYPVLPQYEFSNFAKITSANFYDSDTTVINIQDLHNNKEVQDNIYKLLESLNKKYENLDVYIEGATDFVDYNKLSAVMSENELAALINALYDNDKISGAELFGYKNNKVLNPTEQKTIYEQNIQNYSYLIKNKQHINDLLFNRYVKIKTLDNYLIPEQRKLLKFYNAYLDKRISSEKFYNKIFNELNNRKISDLKYINTKLYIDVMKASKNINQKSAEMQLKTLLANLKTTITYQDYVNLLKDSNNLTDINVIFAYLSANISSNDKITKYPDLFKLISLRELSSLINPLDLIEEERNMLEDILLSYSKYTQNKDVVFLNLFFQIYKKLLSAAISSSEYEYYKKNYYRFSQIYSKYLSNDLFELYGYTRVAEQFNELNLKRNLSFIKNLSSNITTDKNYNSYFRGKLYNIDKILTSLDKAKSVKVIVSGGFHTEGINDLLDKNKISYITLTPNVKENDSLYEQKYLDSIVEQADIETNAIAKRPYLQQNAQIIIGDIVSSLDSILKYIKEGKTLEEIEKIINGVIKANSLQDFVSFNISDEGIATIKVDDKTYTLNYEKGKVVVQNSFSTSLAKNIKSLIREALKISNIRSILGLKPKYDGTIGSGFKQEAEYFFMKHNILFPGFADICLRAIVGDSDPDVSDRSKDNVYQTLLKVKSSFMGDEFKCDITVGRSNALVGARPDGYGNTEEYGSLFYVVWEQNADGVYVAKNILVSNILLESLQNFQAQDLRKFFTNLFIHERLEMLAVTGSSEKFNQYALENNLSRTAEVFHQYIQSADFYSFLAEQGLSSDNLQEQRALLKEMDRIISEVNKANSQYSNIISVSSLEGDRTRYSEEALDSFLSIRAGEKSAINGYNSMLLKKVVAQIEKEYVLAQKTINPNFNIETDLNKDDFIRFANKFVVVYRKSNNYISSNDFAISIRRALENKFKVSGIFISSYELNEDSDGNISLKDSKNIKGKKIFFIEDIISRQSETFNNVYNTLMDYGADKVQGAVFFDLSKETEESESITNSVYKQIMEEQDGSKLMKVITSVNGDIQKYLAYWLVKLSQNPKGESILKQISSMDSQIVDNLMNKLMKMVMENNFSRGVKCYEIINLMLFIGFGEYKDINSLTKAEMDEFLKKYDFRVKDKGGKLALEVSYDDWKESIASLMIYAYMLGYDYIDAVQINNIVKKYGKSKFSNKAIIDAFCKEFNISFTDKKTKLKHTYRNKDIEDVSDAIETQKQNLSEARKKFEDKAKELRDKYEGNQDYEKYLAEMDKISAEYRTAVKNVMIAAKEIVIKKLASQKMKIDDNLFAIVIGGSLVKGNMMVESDIYYDIIVPDGTISKSIDNHFAPLYSSILQEIGLTNYYVLKYSTTNMNRRNINTFVDEKDIAPFLNYSPLIEDDAKKQLFLEYRKQLLEDIDTKKKQKTIQQSLALITKKYFNISQKGKSWLGNSFHIAYDGKKSFSTRWTIMALESKLNEIIFKYVLDSGDQDIAVPVSVKEQFDFIRQHNLLDQTVIKKLEFYWKYLSACRYTKDNNTWTRNSAMEREAIDKINEFISSNIIANPADEEATATIKNTDDLLSVIEDFVYDNSSDLGKFRRGYNKYSHLEAWKNFTDTKNSDIFTKAQMIALLVEIDSPEIREKLNQTKISKKDLDFIFESLNAIKMIDEHFPDYSSIKGERSLQNYWDAVATTTKNPETMFALIAHKLTKAQSLQNKEDQLLLYSVYLPLSKRFGNPDIYEYVRNDSFECSHPVEYLNLLNIISTLYGIPYSKLKESNRNLKQQLEEYFKTNGLNMGNIDVKIRVKSLYSIYEKLNSSRKNDDEELKNLSKIERNAIKFAVNSDEIFNNLVKDMDLDNISPKSMKKQILNCIDKNFADLTPKEKKYLSSILAEMKNALFADYNFIDSHINKKLAPMLKECRGANGLVDIEKLKEILEAGGSAMALELWFVTLFETQLKDLVGFHVVVQDEDFPKVLDVVNAKTTNENYSGLRTFFAERGTIFQKFDKDTKNKQARTKINASVKLNNGLPIPVEMCLYERTDYENETYGLYNQKKISAPHYIYKMGKDFDANLFEHIFAKEMDYSFIDSTDQEKKQMVYESDGIIPTDDLSENFRKIMKKLSGSITCFVEYEDGIYVQKLPKGSNVFDLATGKHFSDDINVAVYIETGDQITSDFPLDDVRTYKIIKREGCYVSVPSEDSEAHTTRSKLIYHRMTNQKISIISNFIKSVGSVSDITEILNMFLTNKEFREILDGRNLDYSEIAEKIFNENSKNKILRDKELITEMLSLLFNIILSNDFENMLPSEFIKRSTQIANHYNLANLFELFEAIEDEIINFNDIKSFYNMCFVIKTKAEINIDEISGIIGASFNIKKLGAKDYQYNLVINNEKFLVEGLSLVNEDSVQELVNLLKLGDIGFKIEHTAYMDEKQVKQNEDTIFVSTGFVQPKQEFPLMSLGNNVEALVRHAMVHHSALVSRILETTKELAEYEQLDKDDKSMESFFEKYPLLMAQILLGLYSQETYDETTLLSQETPLLTQEELNIVKTNITDPDFSAFISLQKEYGVDLQQELDLKQISEVKFVVSRSLDLAEDQDTYSFATLDIDSNGIATIYISEAFLRELDEKTSKDKEKKERLLKQLALHEIVEYLLLFKLSGDMKNYEVIHKQFEKIKEQKELLSFAQSVVPDVLDIKGALFQEVDTLLSPCNFDKMDPNSTVGFLLGNKMISSFEKTYELYSQGKFSKIFISGNTRGTLGIIERLRTNVENKKYIEGIATRNTDANAVRTVKDLLSLTPEIFNAITTDIIDSVKTESLSQPLLLDENLTTPISRDEIFDVVSKDGISEAAIIKWIMLEYARQDWQKKKNKDEFKNMSEKEFNQLSRKKINQLIRSMVLETKASNTPENIEYIFAKKEFNDFVSGKEKINVVIIQTPFSQTRAGSTLNNFLHKKASSDLQSKEFNVYNMNFGIESEYYHYKNASALTLSLGEWTRLIAYALKGDVIPIINSEEGLNSIPLEILVNILNLLPVLTDKEKTNLFKIFKDIAKQNPAFDSYKTLLPLLQEQITDDNRFYFISDIVKYLYSDTTTRRELEETWNVMQEKGIFADIITQERLVIEERVANTQKILAAA